MSLSSNTIIHFTSDKNALKSILSEDFRIKYCKETIIWDEHSCSTVHVPMVSFCDIPLSQVKDHISKYGHYGIGLSRAWAINNKLNPVIYLEPNSNLAVSLGKFMHKIGHVLKEDTLKENEEILLQILDVGRYIKNYEGPLSRDEITTHKYRFSDEREWRYVPDYSCSCKILYTEQNYSQEEAEESLSSMRLSFVPNDVKYIIIKDDTEISEFIEHLRKAKGKEYSQDDIERLTTRILTSEQIHNDI